MTLSADVSEFALRHFSKVLHVGESQRTSTSVKQSAEVLGSRVCLVLMKEKVCAIGLSDLAFRPTSICLSVCLAGSVVLAFGVGACRASPLVLHYSRSCVNVNVLSPGYLLSPDFQLLFEILPSIRSAEVDTPRHSTLPGAVLGAGDVAPNKMGRNPCPHGADTLGGETD